MTLSEVEQHVPEAEVRETQHSFVIKFRNVSLQIHKERDAKGWTTKVAYARHLQSQKD